MDLLAEHAELMEELLVDEDIDKFLSNQNALVRRFKRKVKQPTKKERLLLTYMMLSLILPDELTDYADTPIPTGIPILFAEMSILEVHAE